MASSVSIFVGNEDLEAVAVADLDSAFREYYPPTDEQRKAAMTKGLVCLWVTNVLWTLTGSIRKRGMSFFWCWKHSGIGYGYSHQVAFEFHKNRINVIGDQASAYATAIKVLEEFRAHFENNVLPKLKTLGKNVALTEAEQNLLVQPIREGMEATLSAISQLQEDHGVALEMISHDQVLKRLEELLKGKIGDPLSPQDEEKARKEAKRRVDEKIPPGYADSEKADPAGDYLLWYQTLEEAKRRKLPILFVTRDVKDDWFRREKNQTISARTELIREAKEVAGCDLVAMPTQSFLFHAREHLNAAVSDKLLAGSELPDIDQRRNDEIIHISRSTQARMIRTLQAAIDRISRKTKALMTILQP